MIEEVESSVNAVAMRREALDLVIADAGGAFGICHRAFSVASLDAYAGGFKSRARLTIGATVGTGGEEAIQPATNASATTGSDLASSQRLIQS